MTASKWFLKVACIISFSFVSVGVVVGLPTGSLTITPATSTQGGAGPLKPAADATAKTEARVDNGAPLPAGAVQIGFENKDEAFAEDKCTMSGSTAQPDSGCGIQWKVILEGHCNVNGFTVNAPGDPYDGSYLTEEAAALWATFTKQNETPVSQTGDAAVTIRNDQAGNLSDVGTVEMGTDDAPFLVQGDPDENFSITLYYGGNAGVELQALRHEVEVGGLAFAGNFDGSISAWQVAPGGTATLLKQANSTDDALWDIK